jgi:hypothetical protein
MSNYTKATNFLSKDSLATGDPAKIIKGSEFDTEFNALQTAVNSKANSVSPAFTGTPTAPTASSATNTTQLATTEYVTTAITAGGVPVGGIIIWSGSAAAIPSGWLLCNGTSSTPDLRNRFVVGAGSTYAVGATGGTADAVVVSHTHTATVTDPGHFHAYGQASRVQGGNDNGVFYDGQTGTAFNTGSKTTGVTVSNSTEGVSGTNANLPPYYALCYIMKS